MGSRNPVPAIRFLHVPRTGGSSIRQAWDLKHPELQGHAPPAAADFLYGCVRNPWDRAVSLWHWLDEPGTFEGWVRAGLCPTFTPGASFEITRPCSWWLAPMSAGPWRHRHDIVFERGLRDADFVVRFETRDEDLAELADMLDRPFPEAHVNASERGPYQDYYGDETERLVGEFYAEDVELYGYEFG